MSHHVSDQMLVEAVEAQGAEFDSHEVIVHIMRAWPREYTMDLYEHVHARDPIQTYHALLGKRLAGLTTIEKVDRPSSANVRRGVTENQGWRKK